MTGADRGFLLLTCHLGDPDRPVLTVPQFRDLTKRVNAAVRGNGDAQITVRDLIRLGYSAEVSQRILMLLSQDDVLDYYLQKAQLLDCTVLTRADLAYPPQLRKRLGLDSPCCLWLKGDPTLLGEIGVSVVGSRELRDENRCFAEMAGRQIAAQGYVLISGNARGTDRTAQDACLEAGGRVIVVVADSLEKQKLRENVLYLSEDCFDAPFSSFRALSRNRVIHALGGAVVVAQSGLGKGGTWQGSTENLRNGWSPVLCYKDGSAAADELVQLGAMPVSAKDIFDIAGTAMLTGNLFDR